MTTFDGWIGRFYRFDPDDEGYDEVPRSRMERDGALVRLEADVLPWTDVVEAATERFPAHRGDLSAWRLVWDRSFPGWDTPEARARDDKRYRTPDSPASKREFHERILREGAAKDRPMRWIESRHLMALHDIGPDETESPEADRRLEALKAAKAILSFRHLVPYTAVAYAAGENVILVGHDEDGLPRFENLRVFTRGLRISDSTAQRRFNDIHWSSFEGVRHWGMPEMAPFRKHPAVRVSCDGDPERPDPDAGDSALTLASAVVVDMAAQGYGSATLRSVEVDVSTGRRASLTVPLQGLATAPQARDRLRASAPGESDWNVTVEPTVAVTARQRLFVYGGEVFGATCPLEGIDISDDAFDARVLVAGADGAWVAKADEAMSGRFVQTARDVAAVLSEKGAGEFALDLGLSGDMVVVEDVLPLAPAETFGLDASHYARLLGDDARGMVSELRQALAEPAPDATLEPYKALYALLRDEVDPCLLTLMLELDGQCVDREGGAEVAGHAARQLVQAASGMVRGLIPAKEADDLGLSGLRSGDGFSSFLGSRPKGVDLVTKAANAVVAVKGGELVPIKR